jgi:hypothetical protein
MQESEQGETVENDELTEERKESIESKLKDVLLAALIENGGEVVQAQQTEENKN